MKLSIFNCEFGHRIVSSVTTLNLKNFQIKRKKAGKAPATVDHDLGKMKTVINLAFDNNMISLETYPTWKKLKKTLRKGEDIRDRILSTDEYERLMDAASSFLRPIIAIGYHCGMRRGEILKMEWQKHVDMKGRAFHLSADITKDKEKRTVPMPDAVHAELKQIIRNISDPNVILYRGKPVKEFRGALRNACKNAGIIYGRNEPDGFTFHDLRHTFTTNARKAGIPESVVMAITGHSTREMFDRYNRIDE